MTHASDLAKLAETFIDRYLVECDARREAEAALAKSEEERATQSANLAASLAECERLKADRAEWERRYVEAETRANYWAEQFNEQSSRRIAAESERDALRRAEAGKGAGVATSRDDERAAWQRTTLCEDPEAAAAHWQRWAAIVKDRNEARTVLAAAPCTETALDAARRVVKERDEWRAKAADRTDEIAAWVSATGCATPDAPTSPAKPADRYVVVERDKVNGRDASWFGSAAQAAQYADACNRGQAQYTTTQGPKVWPELTHAVVRVATAPQPSPQAVGVDAERLAELHADITAEIDPESEDGVRWYRWRELTAKDHATATEAMRRAIATVGARPAKVLTEEMLATARALCCGPGSTATADDRRWAKEAMRHLGPVALPALDVEALRQAIDEHDKYAKGRRNADDVERDAFRTLAKIRPVLDAILAANGTVTP